MNPRRVGSEPVDAPPPRIVVMAKYPTPGQVKTRLAARIGTGAAARLQAAFVHDLAARLAAAALDVVWAVAPDDAPFAALLPPACVGSRIVPQGMGDLGSRMRRAMEGLLLERPGTVVALGCDLPHLDPACVHRADAALGDGADVVLGPAADGGYYLIALRRPLAAVFEAIPWGTASVLAQTLERAAAAGARVAQLEPAFDVDDWNDVVALRRLLAAGRVVLPATAAVLESLAPPR